HGAEPGDHDTSLRVAHRLHPKPACAPPATSTVAPLRRGDPAILSAGDGVENGPGDLTRLLVEREVPSVGDRHYGHVRGRFENALLLVRESDLVVLAENDPRRHARIAKSRGKRAVAIEVLEIPAVLLAEEAGSFLFNSAVRASRRGGGKLLLIAGPTS